MDAMAVRTSRYCRMVDSLFGRVERFEFVYEHRVRIRIGNSYFTSNKTYASSEAARKAACRLMRKDELCLDPVDDDGRM